MCDLHFSLLCLHLSEKFNPLTKLQPLRSIFVAHVALRPAATERRDPKLTAVVWRGGPPSKGPLFTQMEAYILKCHSYLGRCFEFSVYSAVLL